MDPLVAEAGDFGDDFPVPKKCTTRPTKLSKEGDILLCIRATIGDLNWADQEYCLGRGVAGLRTNKNELDSSYLCYWLMSAKRELEKLAKGSTFKQIKREDIASLRIPRFSLHDQRRIATILDKPMASPPQARKGDQASG